MRKPLLVIKLNWLGLFAVLLALLVVANVETLGQDSLTEVTRQKIGFPEIHEAEQRLSELGYWTGQVDGKLDPGSRQALIAFQKVEGRQRTGRLTIRELEALRAAARPLPQHGGYAHVEIDLQRQVLFVVDASNSITHILPVCSGNEKLYLDHGQMHRAHTPKGHFKVQRKISGWRRSTLGLLYYPSYIHEGIAIHGSLSMATYPDSHGCIRVPMFAAKELHQLLPVGTDVIVY